MDLSVRHCQRGTGFVSVFGSCLCRDLDLDLPPARHPQMRPVADG